MIIKDIEKVRENIFTPADSVVISHRNPDGDAVGSSLAFAGYLRQHGHTVTIVFPSDYPEFYKWMTGIEDCLVFDNFPSEVREKIAHCKQIFVLDFNSWERVDPLQLQLLGSKARKTIIDHHLDPEPDFDDYYTDDQASSTCELVFRLIEELGEKKRIDIPMAEALYTGIITDTGSFKYNITSELFRVAGELIALGIDANTIQNKIFNTLKPKTLQLLGHCLSERMRIFPDLGMGYIYLTLKDHKDYNLQRGDTEGIVNYILKIDGINVAALIKEQPGYVKFSLRSKGDFSVQKIASQHLNGGGHKNASGGRLNTSLKEALDRFTAVAKENKTSILQSFS